MAKDWTTPIEEYAGVSVAGEMETTTPDHVRQCLLLINEEQRKPNPDNALIGVLCDSVRLARKYALTLTYMQ